jgi:ATP-dependent RNA helicase SUPV3L1/SUV3
MHEPGRRGERQHQADRVGRRRDDRPRRKHEGRPRRERDDWKRELRPEPRERPIDPNSPFAALAALKAKLEAAKKGE